jgi:CxxC motif-containing protein
MKKFYCIICPNGCILNVEEKHQGGFSVTGNTCKRGEDFAIAEMTHPMRTLTTTVRTIFPAVPVLPVRTLTPVPKEKIPALMTFINSLTCDKKIGIGEPVAENALNLGVTIAASSNILLSPPAPASGFLSLRFG